MAVYVDDMKVKYRGMFMCHMIADTEEELHAMADKIGVQRKWHQCQGTHKSHYDICLTKKALAIKLGAIEITMRQLALIVQKRLAIMLEAKRGK